MCSIYPSGSVTSSFDCVPPPPPRTRGSFSFQNWTNWITITTTSTATNDSSIPLRFSQPPRDGRSHSSISMAGPATFGVPVSPWYLCLNKYEPSCVCSTTTTIRLPPWHWHPWFLEHGTGRVLERKVWQEFGPLRLEKGRGDRSLIWNNFSISSTPCRFPRVQPF